MKIRNIEKKELLVGCFSVCFLLSTFVYWYSSGSAPLGWDTPNYIKDMMVLKEEGLLGFLKHTSYVYILYSLLGGVLSMAFGIPPYRIEVYLPIIFAILHILAWFHLSRKWFKDKEISTLTLLFTITWYSTFDFPVFRHGNLFGITISLFALAYIPQLYTERKISKKLLAGLWFLFLLAGLGHPQTIGFLWGVLFLTTLIPFIPNKIREIVKLNVKIDHIRRKRLFTRIFLLGTAVFIPIGLGMLGEGKTMIYPSLSLPSPLLYFFYYHLTEVFLDFGGFLIIFFFFGLRVIYEKLEHEKNSFRFKESLLLTWTVAPPGVLILAFIWPSPFITYARRALLTLPIPVLTALGVNNFLRKLKEIVPVKSLSSLGITKKHTQFKAILTLSVVVPMMGTEYLIYDELNPPRRFISEKTIHQLKWIGNRIDKNDEPIFVIFTSMGEAPVWVNVWTSWIKCYINSFYVYPGIIERLLAGKQPRCLEDNAGKFYNKMKEDGIMKELAQHTIYVLPEFYKHGKFNAEELPLVKLPHKEIYLLQVPSTTTTIAKNFKRAEVALPFSSHSIVEKKTKKPEATSGKSKDMTSPTTDQRSEGSSRLTSSTINLQGSTIVD